MKHQFMPVLAALTLTSLAQADWFGGNRDHEQLSKVESELHTQRQSTGDWMITAGILGIGCCLLFGVGAAIGSMTRKAGKDE